MKEEAWEVVVRSKGNRWHQGHINDDFNGGNDGIAEQVQRLLPIRKIMGSITDWIYIIIQAII